MYSDRQPAVHIADSRWLFLMRVSEDVYFWATSNEPILNRTEVNQDQMPAVDELTK